MLPHAAFILSKCIKNQSFLIKVLALNVLIKIIIIITLTLDFNICDAHCPIHFNVLPKFICSI